MVPGIFFFFFLFFTFRVFLKWRCRTLIQPKISTPELHHGTYLKKQKRGGSMSCSNSTSLFPLTKWEILAWISADGSHDTHATFILSSSTLNLRHFSIVMGSKCKGIMGTVVLCTSCPLLSECVISHTVCFPLKKACVLFWVFFFFFFQLSILYFSWRSYMDLIFYLLLSSPGMPFYSEAAQENTFLSLILSHQYRFISVQTKRVPIVTRYIPLFLSSFEVVFNHMAHFGMLSDMLIVFLITPELCKPSFFGLPFRKSHRKPIY